VRKLVKILLGGLVVFMVLSIAQEWEFFSGAWFGEPEEVIELPHEDLAEAANAIHMTLSLMRHFYMSDGDPRFRERMPAAEWIIDEMAEDITYLQRNRRLQDASLEQMEVLSSTALDRDRVEIITREFWHVKVLFADNGTDAQPPLTQVAHGRYLVARTGQGWRVEGWEPTVPDAVADEGKPSEAREQ
jgi:hypothetical protein